MSDTAARWNPSHTPFDTPSRAAAAGAPPATLANVNLFVHDPERARRFYVEALGLRDDARSAPPHFVLLDAGGGCTLTLQAARALGESLDHGAADGAVELGFELAVGTADGDATAALDAAAARLSALGGVVGPPQVMGWARGFDGRDPDGHRLTVFVRSPEGRPAAERPAVAYGASR
ncbi:MAG TPA: VOC family protein [Gemmatirosa sp.]